MITREAKNCNDHLDFKPLNRSTPFLPTYSWGAFILTNFENWQSSLIIDLKSEDRKFSEVVFAIYPDLTICELARLYSPAKEMVVDCNWYDFFKNYKLRYCENLVSSFQQIIKTSSKFQSWCSEKQLSLRDLSILRSIQLNSSHNDILNKIVALSPSKSVGVQLIELAIESY